MAEAVLEGAAKPFVRPSKSPESLAELVSNLPKQQQAEMMYELVLFAGLAAEETGHEALNEFLSELESLAEVYTDPEKSRALRRTVSEDLLLPQLSLIGSLGA
ncbi:MAG: hypothetical protein H7Z41_09975 [Cytophagales bacterium]|nr:hypothetical protein [Armatimonadota bacterium]